MICRSWKTNRKLFVQNAFSNSTSFRLSSSNSFVLKESRFLQDLRSEAQLFSHGQTGLEWVHIPQATNNNVFVIGFPTPPPDSTGLPHILEHLALCGSARFPVRDPFFKMLNRSLATFMNALTFDDMTMYPFSSENKTDFNNLLSVYLDSVFAPRLRKLDFMQEGWRLEHQTPADPSTPIVFKGVVYNEMKGALADTSSLFVTRHQQALMPDSVYANVSGGDPEHITSLSHDDLVAFHGRCYNPVNARIFTYGSFPVHEQMDAVETAISSWLSRNQQQPLPKLVVMQDVPLWTQPKEVNATGPLDPAVGGGDPDRQTRHAVSFLVGHERNVSESLAVKVLADLLVDGAASPMYRSLIESGLGSDFAPTTGYSPYAIRTSFSVGLQGMRRENVSAATEAIHRTLKECLANPSALESRLESVLHQIELSLKHRTSNFGMHLGWTAIRHMIHGVADPLHAIDSFACLNALKTDLRQPGYLSHLLNRVAINNPHRLTFTMVPDDQYASDLTKSESDRLTRMVNALTDDDRKRVVEDGKSLLAAQDAKENLDCLPCVSVSDVPLESNLFDVKIQDESDTSGCASIRRCWRETQTNGVSYAYMKWPLKSVLTHRETMLLPFMCHAMTSLGTQTKSLGELDDAIRKSTGGISVAPFASSSLSDSETNIDSNSCASIMLSASALDEPDRLETMYQLVSEIVQAPQWRALDHLKICLDAMSASVANSVPDQGHVYAIRSSSAAVNPHAPRMTEMLDGMTQVAFLDNLVQDVSDQTKLKKLSKELQVLAQKVFVGPPADVMVVCQDSVVEQHKRIQNDVFASWGPSSAGSESFDENAIHDNQKETKSNNEIINYPMELGVNFTARSIATVPYSHPDSAPLRLLASLMTNHFLHRELREKGGAYGGGARASALDGVFSMMSYRDPPQASRTMSTYDRAIEWATSIVSHVTKTDLDQAKLDVIKGLDKPVDASQEGLTWFQYGLENEIVQNHRNVLLNATIDDVERVAQTYLRRSSATCVIGEKC